MRGWRILFPVAGAVMTAVAGIATLLAYRLWSFTGLFAVAVVLGACVGWLYYLAAKYIFAPTYDALEKRTAWMLKTLGETRDKMKAQSAAVDRQMQNVNRLMTEARARLNDAGDGYTGDATQ